MNEPFAPIARRAAERLSADLDPTLPAFTERALAGGGEPEAVTRYDAGVSIALAALLLSVAQFGWQIYRDLKKDREEQAKASAEEARRTREVLIRRLRLSVGEPRGLSIAQRDRLLEVVAEEIVLSEDGPG